MKKTYTKGSIAPLVIIVAVLVIAAIWWTMSKNKEVAPAPVATSSPITLISPNGGETLVIGATTTVTFKTEGELASTSQVVIWFEEGGAPIATIPATSTSYSFVVPSSVLIGGDAVGPLATGPNKIKVSLYDGVPCTGFCQPSSVKELGSDSSDGIITIATSTTSVATSTPATN
jgi:hypothetical protein